MYTNDAIRKTDSMLYTTEHKLLAMINYGNDIITLISAEGIVKYRSPSYTSILGYDLQEAEQMSVFETVHPDDRDAMRDNMKLLMANPGKTFKIQWRQKHKNGSFRWMEGTGTNLLDDLAVNALVCNFRDITEHIENKQLLEKSNQELNRIFNSIDEVIYSSTRNPYRLTKWSEACLKIYGYSSAEFMERDKLWFELILDEDKHVIDTLNEILARGEVGTCQYRVWHKDGSIKWIEASVTPTLDEKGEVIRIDGVNRDITERKKSEQALLDSEMKFRTLIENNKEVISLTNARRQIMYISPAIKEILGYEPEELIGADSFTLMHSDETTSSLNMRESLMTEQSQDFLIRGRHKNGSWRWLEVRLTNKLDDPSINAFVTNMRDVTERRIAEELLLNREKRFRTLIENSKDGIALSDSDRKFVYVSPAVKDITGYEPEELIGKNTYDFFHPAEEAENDNFFAGLINKVDPFARKVLRVLHKDGNWRWVELIASNKLDDPAINAIVTNFRDVTDKKSADEALLNSERRFRKMIENNKEIITLTDADRIILYMSPNLTDTLGYELIDLVGTPISDLHHPDDRERMSELVGDLINHKTDFVCHTYRMRHKNGSWRWIEATITNQLSDPTINALVGNLRDVTERKLAKDALLHSEQRHRGLIENNKDGIGLTDSNQRFIYLSPAVKNILGYEPEELIGTGAFERYHPDDLPSMIELSIFIRTESNASASNQVRIRHKDRSWRWIELTATNKLDDPAINAIVTNFRDVTERRNAEEAILYSEQRFKTLIEKNKDVIALSASDGSVVYMSPSIKELLDYEPTELLGKSAADLMHPEELEKNLGHLKWIIENPGEPVFKIMRMRHRDGSWRWVESTSTSQLDNPAVNAIVSNLRDITERKLAQDELEKLNLSLENKVKERTLQLEESNKALESFSSMAAHDLQAPLRILSGYASILKQDYQQNLGAEGAGMLEVMMKQTRHMTHLIADLLTFSRVSHSIMKREKVNLDEMVSELTAELRLTYGSHTATEIKLSPIGSCSCDAGLMRQVWSNLISNALKYSGKKEHPEIEIGKSKINGETVYYIKDNGAGFDQCHEHKLFTVFQRLHTASDFEGTGVGLALVKNVVTRHGGRVWAKSEIGQGATFYFSLPG